MKTIKTYTLSQLSRRLTEVGIKQTVGSLAVAIRNGFLAGCAFCATVNNENFFIIARDVEAWIDEHCVDEEPNEDMLRFAEMMESDSSKQNICQR